MGMMQYDGDLKLPAKFLVPPPEIHKVGTLNSCTPSPSLSKQLHTLMTSAAKHT